MIESSLLSYYVQTSPVIKGVRKMCDIVSTVSKYMKRRRCRFLLTPVSQWWTPPRCSRGSIHWSAARGDKFPCLCRRTSAGQYPDTNLILSNNIFCPRRRCAQVSDSGCRTRWSYNIYGEALQTQQPPSWYAILVHSHPSTSRRRKCATIATAVHMGISH